MSETPIDLSQSGPTETVIGAEPTEALDALAMAMALPEQDRREAVAKVVADWPRFLDGWARLGELGRDPVERYAVLPGRLPPRTRHPAWVRLAR
ncbi:MAG: hypothetical protein V9E94_11275 [Microthrixaceae bacterium]